MAVAQLVSAATSWSETFANLAVEHGVSAKQSWRSQWRSQSRSQNNSNIALDIKAQAHSDKFDTRGVLAQLVRAANS